MMDAYKKAKKMTPEAKRRQLERRGWSPARIEQYMRDWTFDVRTDFKRMRDAKRERQQRNNRTE